MFTKHLASSRSEANCTGASAGRFAFSFPCLLMVHVNRDSPRDSTSIDSYKYDWPVTDDHASLTVVVRRMTLPDARVQQWAFESICSGGIDFAALPHQVQS